MDRHFFNINKWSSIFDTRQISTFVRKAPLFHGFNLFRHIIVKFSRFRLDVIFFQFIIFVYLLTHPLHVLYPLTLLIVTSVTYFMNALPSLTNRSGT